jgi:hypothetical protein
MSPEYLQSLFADRPADIPMPVHFVESGTFEGKTAMIADRMFSTVHTVEISPVLYEAARQNFYGTSIFLYQGDSAELIPRFASRISAPVVWYLDAHWFHREPGQLQIPDSSPFPLWTELEAIAKRPYADCVIVDDVSVFGKGPDDWPWPIDERWEGVTGEAIMKALDIDRLAVAGVHGDAFVAWRNAV